MSQEERFIRLIIHKLFFMIIKQERKIVDFIYFFMKNKFI
jgi:hypothetical protein